MPELYNGHAHIEIPLEYSIVTHCEVRWKGGLAKLFWADLKGPYVPSRTMLLSFAAYLSKYLLQLKIDLPLHKNQNGYWVRLRRKLRSDGIGVKPARRSVTPCEL
jgi:hypothetical protein